MKAKLSHLLLLLSSVCCLIPANNSVSAVYGQPTVTSLIKSENKPLWSVLKSAGPIIPRSSSGLDPKDFKMTFGPMGEPKFAPAAQMAPAACGDGWDDRFGSFSINGSIAAVASDSAGNIYVGGSFSAINGVAAARIAKWNGSAWSPLGSGISGIGEFVTAIAVSGNDLYVGTSLGVKKWNGTSWTNIGNMNDRVLTVTVSGTDVYAAGNFGTVNGVSMALIAKWDGSSWSALGSGLNGSNAFVREIAVAGSNVYAAGRFTNAGGVSVSNIAKWDGSSWSGLGTGMDTEVAAIAVSGTEVYAGGAFTTAGGIPVSNIAKWDGTSWSALGSGMNSAVLSLTVSGGNVYAGGSFTTAGGIRAGRIAKWDGTTWQAIGNGIAQNVESIAVTGTMLYTAGTDFIRKWDGSSWLSLGTGFDGAVSAIAISGSEIYVGGSFLQVGDTAASYIAKWNGSTWSALGTGMDGPVSAIAVSGSDLYAGGSFTTAGGVPANNIAKWNGSSWSALGSGTNNRVSAIAVSGNDIYAGGSFTSAGGNAANYVAKWDGNSWTALGSGVSNGPTFTSVNAIAISGSDVYVGGTFSTAGGTPANYIAKWNGGTWSALGSSSFGFINDIEISGSDVYIATTFITAGSGTSSIRKWNGSAWSNVENGIFGGIYAIAVSDNIVYGGGLGYSPTQFTPPVYLSKITGSSTALGTYPGSKVDAIAVSGTDLYVGGNFRIDGCGSNSYFGRFFQTQWAGGSGTDWHTAANWNTGSVPAAGASMVIGANNAAITSADVTVKDLAIKNGKTVSIAAGRTLTVTGNLNLNGGSITGPGSVVVTSCDPNAITGGGSTGFVAAPLTRCVNNSGAFKFPVGTGSSYSPVELSDITGAANFTVEANAGAFSGTAAGLPADRLNRWWNLVNGGITRADVKFQYTDADVTGAENDYRAYRINAGTAELVPTVLSAASNTATVQDVTAFSAWTLASSVQTFGIIGGQVTTASGRGAAGVTVTLTGIGGSTRYAMTNPFGYYRFVDVQTGSSYAVRVASKRFQFTQPERTVQLIDSLTNVDFVSISH